MWPLFRSASLLPMLLIFPACAYAPWNGDESLPAGAPRTFASPEAAVTEASRLLNEGKWERLSAYYDLEGTAVERTSLVDGSFFSRPVPSAAEGAPALRQWHPFHPGSRFSHVNPAAEADEVEVVVEYETEVEGGLKLRGYDAFRMRRSVEGWRLLPE